MLGSLARDPDLETCSHRHDILAIAAEADEALPVPMTLYHWCPPTVHATTTVVLSPRLLSMVKGFTFLGTFFLGDELDMSEMLTRLLTERGGNPEPTSYVLTGLIAELATPGQGTFMHFFSFPVFSNNPSHLFGDGLFPVWKWVKPESIYRKTGFWEADLATVLDHGEWNAGKDLVLLSGGVAEETLGIIVAGDRKFPGLGPLLAMLRT
ncbi:uncharacterized protein P884DRAFT_260883 [Thermothelomyces heterothallicus CBS 202.75]|uniref:uncharacterized protein n=1 Tax=Thermothelomyces heterothallicus CBS 202.75 TaxID=1149848 RepID=UPI0037445FBE